MINSYKLLMIILGVALLSTGASCKKEPPIVPPEPPPTVDTTSQNFTVEVHEIGDNYGSAWFDDVWIFDEKNIIAVGYAHDPLFGHKNILRWNGNAWSAVGEQFNSAGISGIWAIDTSEIYYASGIVLAYRNGVYTWADFSGMDLSGNRGVEKIWGTDRNNIWGVGPSGTVVHFDGTIWSEIFFDRQWSFFKITGNKDKGVCYAVAKNISFETIIVELKSGQNPTIIYTNRTAKYPMSVYSISMIDNQTICIASNQVVFLNLSTKEETLMANLLSGPYVESMGSSSRNDIFMFGTQYGGGVKMTHYNGARFTTFDISDFRNSIYGRTFVAKDIAAMTSFANDKAVLTIIRRVK
jgi:hypothetical protein